MDGLKPRVLFGRLQMELRRLWFYCGVGLIAVFFLATVGLAIALGIVANQTKSDTVPPAPDTTNGTSTFPSPTKTTPIGTSSTRVTPTSPPIPAVNRIDCHPDKNKSPTADECHQRGCIWDTVETPQCYYGSDTGYKVSQVHTNSIFLEPLKTAGPFGNLLNVNLKYEYLSSGLHFRLTDSNDPSRYEVASPNGPVPIWPSGKPAVNADSDQLDFVWNADVKPFSFQIKRKSTGSVLWDTSLGGMVLSDQFLQISTKLPSDRLYGFGENTHQTLKHDMTTWKNWYLFARDEAPTSVNEDHKNLYGVHPFFLCIESDGNAFGVILLNSNAQEYQTTPAPGVVYRTIGGIFDFYLFAGPTPFEVIRQYWQLIGNPIMPSYWALGFQLCRYGYKNLQEVKDVVSRTRAAGIPQDVQYVDIDYMDSWRDFTTDQVNFAGIAEYFEELHQEGMKIIVMFDPAINVYDPTGTYAALQHGLQADVFVKWPSDTDEANLVLTRNYTTTNGTHIMLGTVWPDQHVAFPNFFNQRTADWWMAETAQFHSQVPFDGLWIDMNEPANFGTNEDRPWYFGTGKPEIPTLKCPNSKCDDPPYPTGAASTNISRISEKTICLVAQLEATPNRTYRHYDVHNLYGWSETSPTLRAVQQATGKRSVVITRSTFPSSGRYAGHWLGDNSANWADMRTSVIGMIEFNMFGLPYVGADICGFHDNTTEELCLRWMQLGSFYPFSRNHNAKGCPDASATYCRPQDPAEMGNDVIEASKISLNFRYKFLPHLYTLFYMAQTTGTPVINPLWMPFSKDSNTVGIDEQFLWGDSMLITPVLNEGLDTVNIYLPLTGDAKDVWYNVRNDSDYGNWHEGGQQLTSHPAPNNSLIPVFLRSGYIYPCQKPELTTNKSRSNPLQLVITAKDPLDPLITSKGQLYWDDGDNLDYLTNNVILDITVSTNVVDKSTTITFTHTGSYSNLPVFGGFEIFGYPYSNPPSSFSFNGVSTFADSTVSGNKVLTVSFNSHINLIGIGSTTVISWQNNGV